MAEGGKSIYSTNCSFLPEETSSALFELYFDNDMSSYMIDEIRRRAAAILMNDGEDCKLLVKKFSGTKCMYWDDQRQQCPSPLGKTPTDTNKCYNTGWQGGYYDPIDIKVRIVPAGETIVIYREGRRIEMASRSWTLWTPEMKTGDLIITAGNDRYRINAVYKLPKLRGLYTRQELDINILPKEDMIYNIPISFTYR